MSTRDEFVEKTKAKIDEWSAEIDKLEAKAKSASAEQRAKYNERVESLRTHRDEAKSTLSKVKEASADAWVEFKAGCEKATNNLVESIKRAKQELTS